MKNKVTWFDFSPSFFVCNIILMYLNPFLSPVIGESVLSWRSIIINNHKKILEEVLKREGLGSTGLEKGIAIPHALTNEVESTVLALAVARDGIDFDAADQKPSYIILLLLGNMSNPGYQLKLLAHVCRLVKETSVIEKIRNAKSVTDICEIFLTEESKIG